jgi:hypothetical protein
MNTELAVEVSETPSTKRQGLSECEYCKVIQIQRFIEGMESQIDYVEGNFISTDGGMWQIVIDADGSGELWVNFLVNTDPALAVRIMENLSRLSSALNMSIRVGESCAFQFDKKGKVSNMTFGDKAYETVGRKPLEIFP